MRQKVVELEHVLKNAALDARVQALENKRQADAVEFGGVTFNDAQSVNAWFKLLKDPEAHRHCPDFVTLLSVSCDTYYTITDGLKANADAKRAGFSELTAAEATITYQIPQPEHILVPTK